MDRGFRYWAGEILENWGLPILGIVLLGATFAIAQLLPWWGPLVGLGAVTLVGSAWVRRGRRRRA